MQIEAIKSQSASPREAGSSGSPAIAGYDAFLQLLIAQLKNQDPTKPVDSTQYVSQLATLSALEQSVKQTAAMNRILSSVNISEASNIIGRRVSTEGSAISGIAVAARIDVDGIVAELADGTKIPLGTGVRIENA